VLAELLRLLAEIGPGVIWVLIFTAAVVAIFVVYVGIALWATLRATDVEQRKVRHEILRDLLELFHRGRRR
jgi:hypothetical protein